MVDFCKSCGQAIRKEGNGWVHYDSSISHNIIPVEIANRDAARFHQISQRGG